MEKEIIIEGLPKIVKVEYFGKKNGAYARINMDGLSVWPGINENENEAMDKLVKALVMLKELGFTYYGTDYSTGYYESVEEITLEFHNKDFKL